MSGGYDLDLLRRARLFGLEPEQVDGWQTRGAPTLSIAGAVGHHTGGAAKGVQPSLGICIAGRPDLDGPLCNFFGPREESRRVVLVAAGRANHAGVGHWGGITGNSSVGGLEEEHTGGPNEPISPLRVERFCRTIAAMIHGRADAAMACMHLEWATPAGRKTDFVKTLIPAATMRTRVAQLLANPSTPWPGDPVEPSQPQEDLVYDLVRCQTGREGEMPNKDMGGAWWFIDAAERAWCPTQGNAAQAYARGQIRPGGCTVDKAGLVWPVEVSPTYILEHRPKNPLDDRLQGGDGSGQNAGHFPRLQP